MVDVTFGAVLCKVAPSTSLSQSMLGCRVGMLGLPEFSVFILIFLAAVLRTGTCAQILYCAKNCRIFKISRFIYIVITYLCNSNSSQRLFAL